MLPVQETQSVILIISPNAAETQLQYLMHLRIHTHKL